MGRRGSKDVARLKIEKLPPLADIESFEDYAKIVAGETGNVVL